jgi:hypothetical protein
MRDATYKRQFNLNLPEQIVEAMGAGARRRKGHARLVSGSAAKGVAATKREES